MKPKLIRDIWDWISGQFPVLALEINYLRHYRRWEPDLWLIPKFFDKNFCAIDIGANMGIYSRWMAKYSNHVESFECNHFLWPYLSKVLPKNAILQRYALSNKSGKAELRFDPNNTGIGTIELRNRLDQNSGIKSIKTIKVDVCRLDDFEFSQVTFIKIDVEGHELEVLKGGENLIKRDKPAILIEIEERHCQGNVKAVPNWLNSIGYEAFIIGKNGELNFSPDISIWASQGLNNFWFLPKKE